MTQFHDEHEDYVLMNWPAYSPDINIIEHACDMLARAVARHNVRPANPEELAMILQVEWAAIHQNSIQKLYNSVRNRIWNSAT